MQQNDIEKEILERLKDKVEHPECECKKEQCECAEENCECHDTKAACECEADEMEQLKKRIAELEAEVKEKDDKYLRMAAEYDNFRRRSREEKDGIYESAVADTVSELLPIIDNLDRASLYEDGEKVKEGLVMTAKSVEAVFSKIGVESFGAAGDSFDPNIHNAVMHIDDDEHKEGEIVEVFQKGYRKGKRIIRFAMVKSAN